MSDFHVFKDKVVHTKANHGCIWCYETIPKGSDVRFRHYALADEPTVLSEWWHDECWTAMTQSDVSYIEEGWMPGDNKRGCVAE